MSSGETLYYRLTWRESWTEALWDTPEDVVEISIGAGATDRLTCELGAVVLDMDVVILISCVAPEYAQTLNTYVDIHE